MFAISANIIQNSSEYISKINFNNPTWDIFIFLIFITIAFFYGVFVGKSKIIHILISSFFSFILVKFNPFFQFIKNLSERDISIINIGLFVFFLIIIYILLIKRSLLYSIDAYNSSIIHLLLFSVLHTGLIISFVLNLLDKDMLASFGSSIQLIFINPIAFFIWIVLSIFALIFLRNMQQE